MKSFCPIALFLGLVITTTESPASSSILTVPGTSDPWLAGMPNGSLASGNDRAPAQSPVMVSGLWFTAGLAFTFDSVGFVGNSPVSGDFPPEGNLLHIPPHGAGAENGIASAIAPYNSLVGVFLGSAQPSLTPAPPSLDFTSLESRNYVSLKPVLRQVFYIGDGRTSDGQTQQVIPPAGATRLFLGTMDEWTWSDNHGSFTVTVAQTNAIPSPSDSFEALADFGPFQGGIRGAWFYQEFNGNEYSDLTFQPSGSSFSSFQPAWAANGYVLPLLFWDAATPDGLVFHPGLPGGGAQPSRHDVVLSWAAPAEGFYSIRGFVRGDIRFGVGGNGFEFGIFRGQEELRGLDIAFNDKTNHPVSLRHVHFNEGERVSFRAFAKGNNEHDVGVFNFNIKPEQRGLNIRVSQVEICWETQTNTTYNLEYRSTLTTNAWTPLGTDCVAGDGSVKCVFDTVPFGEPQRFYRVITNCVVLP